MTMVKKNLLYENIVAREGTFEIILTINSSFTEKKTPRAIQGLSQT